MKKFCLILVFLSFYLFLAGLSGKSSIFAAGQVLLHISFTNHGDSPTANVDYNVVREDGTEVVSRRNIFVGSNTTVETMYIDPQGNFTGYTIYWTGQKSEGVAPGDDLCWDPEEGFYGGILNDQNDIDWVANVDFTCNLPPSGPSQPTGFSGNCNDTTGSNSWNAASGASYYVVINGTSNPPENGGYSSQSPSGTSVSWGGLSPGVTYYQRINAVSSSGAWSSPSYASFTCPSTAPPPGPPPPPPSGGHAGALARSIPSCAVGLYDASFSWSGSGSGWFLDVTTDASWSGWEPQDVSFRTSTGWPGLPTNTTIYWRVWDTIDHHYGASFNVPECGSGTPPPPPPSYAYPTPATPPPPPPPDTVSSVQFRFFNDLNGDGIRGNSASGERFGTNFSTATMATLTVDGAVAAVATDGETAYFDRNIGTNINFRINVKPGWVGTRWENSLSVCSNSTSTAYTSPLYSGTHKVVGGTSSDCAYTVDLGIIQTPQPPGGNAGLVATPSCVGSNLQVAFSWANFTAETGYWLDINGAAWTGDSSPSPWGVKTLGTDVTNFVWTASAPVDSGDVDPVLAAEQRAPVSGKTYYWRIKAFNAVGSSAHYYPQNSQTPPGVSFTTPFCGAAGLDLKARFVSDATSPSPVPPYTADQSITIKVRVTNIGTVASAPTVVGLWRTSVPAGATPDPGFANCTGLNAGSPIGSGWVASGNVGVLAGGASVDVPITFNLGSAGGVYTANAYVIPQCNQNDVYWGNNATNGTLSLGPNGIDDSPPGGGGGDDDTDGPGELPGGFTYTLTAPGAWFETRDGDVGSAGNIISNQPPNSPTAYNSSYLLAGGALQNVQSSGFRLSNYTSAGHRLVPVGSVYNYLAQRFKSKATVNACPSASLPESVNHLYLCTGPFTLNAGVGSLGHNVFFVDGDLNVLGNYTLPAGDNTVTFIVSGDITVDNAVTQLDGIYIAGNGFTSGAGAGKQLLINGAVYTNTLSFGRSLASSNCGVAVCDNAVSPAELLIFDPKYLVGLSAILGSSSFSWREVTP